MYIGSHSVQGLSQGTVDVRVYRAVTVYRGCHSVQGLSQCTAAVTGYKSYHRIHGLYQCTGSATVNMNCHSIQEFSQGIRTVTVYRVVTGCMGSLRTQVLSQGTVAVVVYRGCHS